jgi:predicted N-acetyltransferase YhbS
MISIRNEKAADVTARERLLDVAYGPSRFRKPSEKIRRGRQAAEGLSLVATDGGRIVGTVRLWQVAAGGVPALLLGPLAVHPHYRGKGLGAQLMQRAIRNARLRGHKAVLLVGDAEYYGRFGFSADSTAALAMPGDCPAHRLLALEFEQGALAGAAGLIVAAGKLVPGRTRRIAAAAAAAVDLQPKLLRPELLRQVSHAA